MACPGYSLVLTFEVRGGIFALNNVVGDLEVFGMTPQVIFFLTFEVLAGLALFILGMNIMTDGLRQAAGSSLRSIMAKATNNPFSGLAMGTVLGTLVHSSATTVMLVGFINAGLMSLVESIPAMLGANIGTTVSMQMISFRLGDYCYFAVTMGFLLQFASPNPMAKNIGRAILGFGLLFLGMNTMSGAIRPHREMFATLLRGIHSNTLLDMLKGIGIATAVTAIIQSSGATIGMCFALISAGVFTSIGQVFPIILGAHIGTCATAMLGSIGTNIFARRSAVSHLAFNVFNVALAVLMSPLYFRYLPRLAPDLVRQAANLHTIAMIIGAVFIMPVIPLYARFINLLIISRKPLPEPSYLDNKLIGYPEKAIYASIQELQRVTKICARSFRLTIDLLFQQDRKKVQAVKLNENVVDEIKLAMKDYLAKLTRRHLSRRQAIIIQHLSRCMADVERIGDHIDALCDICVRRHKTPNARFNRDTLELLFSLYSSAENVLHLIIDSLDPDNTDFQGMAQSILMARDEYVEKSLNAKAMFTEKLANHEIAPIVGMFFSEYVAAFDRIVKHAKTIALAEKQPFFWIKRKKLERLVEEIDQYPLPPMSNAQDFLDRLHSEDYL